VELEFRADDGEVSELRSLYEWLRRADDLRKSSVSIVPAPVRTGAMGADISHLLVEVWPVEVVVLGAVVAAWLRTRGVDLEAERSPEGGIKIRIRRAGRKHTRELGEKLTQLLREEAASADTASADPKPDDYAGDEPRGE